MSIVSKPKGIREEIKDGVCYRGKFMEHNFCFNIYYDFDSPKPPKKFQELLEAFFLEKELTYLKEVKAKWK